MTPEHEAELHERAHDNIVLKMLVDMRCWSTMSDEDFYHVALMTMTDVANTFQKCATDAAMKSRVDRGA